MADNICEFNPLLKCKVKDAGPVECLNCLYLFLMDNFNLLYSTASTGLIPFVEVGKVHAVSTNFTMVMNMYRQWVQVNLPEHTKGIFEHIDKELPRRREAYGMVI